MPSSRYSRYYFVSDSLDDLEQVEVELESQGVAYEQFHVLSSNDSEMSQHKHLHEVPSFMRRDMVNSSLKGALIGLIIAPLLLLIVSFTNLTENVGWMPFIFLSVLVLGFCTWEGGFLGIQTPNKEFVRFEGTLHEGKYVFFVDVESSEESKLMTVLQHHPKLTPAGAGSPTPKIVLQAQHGWNAFTKVFP